MCDCSESKIKEDQPELSMKTITLFQKCTKFGSNRDDYIDESSKVIESTCGERKLIVSNIDETNNCQNEKISSPRLSSSESSRNDSERQYKFVNRWKLECGCEIDGEDEAEECISDEETCVDDFEESEEESSLQVECTLAIIKPEAVENRKSIEDCIIEKGFAIIETRWIQMTSEQVTEFYANKYGSDDFAHIVAYMSSGSIIVHVLAKKEAIQEWRSLMGPTKVTEARMYFPDSIRARYGRKGDNYKNAVHGSASRQDAEREIHFFFPELIFQPILKDHKAENYLTEVVNKILSKGLALCCQLKPTDPITWLANWLIDNNPNTPKNCNPAADTVVNFTK